MTVTMKRTSGSAEAMVISRVVGPVGLNGTAATFFAPFPPSLAASARGGVFLTGAAGSFFGGGKETSGSAAGSSAETMSAAPGRDQDHAQPATTRARAPTSATNPRTR